MAHAAWFAEAADRCAASVRGFPSQTAGAHDRFERLHFWLGTIVGETVGYAVTATFTVLMAGTRRPR